ncbi:MAG: hypothetical protein ACRCY4_03430 [Brevinema sp.]
MRKCILYASLFFVPFQVLAQDQDASPKVFREISVGISAESGSVFNRAESVRTSGNQSVVTPGLGLWDGNEIKATFVYSQNWASAPWLSMYSALEVSIVPEYDRNPDGTTIGRFPGDAPTSATVSLGLIFGDYFAFYVNSDLLVGFGLWYNARFENHTFGIRGNVELLTGKTSLSSNIWRNGRQQGINSSASRVGNTEGPIVDEAYIDLSWGARMPHGFANTFVFRPIGFGGDNQWEILEKMFVRFENTLSWSNDSIGLWFTLRYQINNVAFPSYQLADGSQWKTGVSHELDLLAGINYSYDLSPSAKKAS